MQEGLLDARNIRNMNKEYIQNYVDFCSQRKNRDIILFNRLDIFLILNLGITIYTMYRHGNSLVNILACVVLLAIILDYEAWWRHEYLLMRGLAYVTILMQLETIILASLLETGYLSYNVILLGIVVFMVTAAIGVLSSIIRTKIDIEKDWYNLDTCFGTLRTKDVESGLGVVLFILIWFFKDWAKHNIIFRNVKLKTIALILLCLGGLLAFCDITTKYLLAYYYSKQLNDPMQLEA